MEILTSKYDLRMVPVRVVPEVWETARPFLQKGAKYYSRYFDERTLYETILSGKLQLWVCCDAGGPVLFLITDMIDYPKASVLRILWVAGEKLSEALGLIEMLELWAARQGAKYVEIPCREGLMRLLAPYGYIPQSVLMLKDISELKEH